VLTKIVTEVSDTSSHNQDRSLRLLKPHRSSLARQRLLYFEVLTHSHFDQQHADKQRHPNYHPPGVKNAYVLAHNSKDQRKKHKGD
jgi:hypothetical protein